MRQRSFLQWLCATLAIVSVIACGRYSPAAPPAAPKVSTFAPADDLIAQVEYFIGRTEKTLADKDEYDEGAQQNVALDAGTLATLAMALGVHDTDNKLKPAAGALIKASQQLAKAAGDYDAAVKALAEVKQATSATGGGEVKWQKVAGLEALMKQVPLVNNRIKRGVRRESRFAKAAKQCAGHAATVAVIAQATLATPSDATKADEWYKLSAEMRDAAAAANAAMRKVDFNETKAAMKVLSKTCHNCHDVFRPEEDE